MTSLTRRSVVAGGATMNNATMFCNGTSASSFSGA